MEVFYGIDVDRHSKIGPVHFIQFQLIIYQMLYETLHTINYDAIMQKTQ